MAAPITAVPPPATLGDVPGLLDESRPRPLVRQAGRAVLAVWAAAVLGPLVGLNAVALETLALLVTLGGSLFVLAQGTALRREVAALDGIEILLARRRPDEAAPALHGLMCRPMRTPENRLRAMLALATTLARLGRGDEAIAVFDALIGTDGLSGPGAGAVKLARAAELLRADRLYDADRAIADVRRTHGRATADPAALAGLRLVEMHQDVKTGHLAEAVERFDAHRPALTAGLGHRVAEAHALAAVALHRLGRPDEAAVRYADATALAPLRELVGRYAELWPLTGVYAATEPPPVR